MLTTWNCTCGIAEYSRHLVDEFIKQGHEVIVFGNNDKNPSFYEGALHTKPFYVNTFGVSFWGEDPKFHFKNIKEGVDIFEKANGKIDVLIVQYHAMLYNKEDFYKFLLLFHCKKVIVRHDSSVAYNLPVFDAEINHWGGPGTVIPFPTIETRPRVFSFGMGRNDYNLIETACKQIGFDFDWHDSKKHGWIKEEALFNRMSIADVIVLWYNEVTIKGGSSALRTAISSCRPVIVNDIGWFKDAPEFVHKVSTRQELYDKLIEVTHYDFIKTNSYNRCATQYMEVLTERCQRLN